ncbi:hypothetical protein MRX96_018620 [Rhipicephalus microplus]
MASQKRRKTNYDNESQSSWTSTGTNHDDFELTGDTDNGYGNFAREDSELVKSPCGTSFCDYEEDEDMFDKPWDSFNVEELALSFIEGGRLTREDVYTAPGHCCEIRLIVNCDQRDSKVVK